MSVCKSFDLSDYHVDDSNGSPVFWRCKYCDFAEFFTEPPFVFLFPNDFLTSQGYLVKVCDCVAEQECIEKDTDDINSEE